MGLALIFRGFDSRLLHKVFSGFYSEHKYDTTKIVKMSNKNAKKEKARDFC